MKNKKIVQGLVSKLKGKEHSNGLILKIKQKSKKQKAIAAVSSVLVIALAGGGIGYYVLYAKDGVTGSQYQEVTVEHGDLSLDLSEDGTTQVSTVSQTPEFNMTEIPLEVEEVYVASGDTVSAGDALLKLTDDSYDKLVAYYEDAIADAQSDLTTAELNYDIGELEAENDRQTANTQAAYADDQYAAELAELDQTVSLAQTAYEGAQTTIDTYTALILNNNYYTDNDIDNKTTAVSDAQAVVDTNQATYDGIKANYDAAVTTFYSYVTALSATSTTVADDIATLQSAYGTMADLETQTSAAKDALATATTDLATATKTLEEAQKSYETAVKNAQDKIDTANSNLSSLKSAYESALRDAVTKKVEIANEYNESVTAGEYADTTYESTMSDLQDDIDTAQTSLDTLQEQQAELLAAENGVITASQDGMIASITYQAEDYLMSGTAVASYYDTSKIMISVEIPQEDIAKISVGDSVAVNISGQRNGELTGTVGTIATSATTGGSVSNVTYAVIIYIDNTDGSLSSGSSSTVTFTFGELSDVDYVSASALSNESDGTAEVKQYDAKGNVISVPVSIGDSTDEYTVITDGIEEGDTCLVEVGGNE